MRDDFSSSTKDLLFKRVCGICSNPNCRKLTCGPSKENNNTAVSNIGVAAHICAASAGGPRYDENMTEEERKSFHNGIWLCQNCAHLIDTDVKTYTVDTLKEWKRIAEENAKQNNGKECNLGYNAPLPDEISSGKMLKDYFFNQINKYKIWDFLMCDTKSVPLRPNDLLRTDEFVNNIDETLTKCRYLCCDLEWKKSYKNISIYVNFLKKYKFLLGLLCFPNPNGEFFYIDDENFDIFKKLNNVTNNILEKIIEAIKNKELLDDDKFYEWDSLIYSINNGTI